MDSDVHLQNVAFDVQYFNRNTVLCFWFLT